MIKSSNWCEKDPSKPFWNVAKLKQKLRQLMSLNVSEFNMISFLTLSTTDQTAKNKREHSEVQLGPLFSLTFPEGNIKFF